MQLTLRDVAELLGVPERTVRRWIEARGLPGHRIRDQWRFHRGELLDWVAHQRPGSQTTRFERARLFAGEAGTPLSDALEAGGVLQELPGATGPEAIRAAVERMELPAASRPVLLEFLLARERLASTALGEGIAIPHPRRPIVLDVPTPRLTVAHLARPLEGLAPDGQPVATLFLLVCPTARAHLRLLARLSTALGDPGLRQALGQRAGREQLLAELRRIEGELARAARAVQEPTEGALAGLAGEEPLP